VPWFWRSLASLSPKKPISIPASPCEICGRKSGAGTGFSTSALVLPCQYHSSVALEYIHLEGQCFEARYLATIAGEYDQVTEKY
jgi:hypothetical protein